MRDDPSHKGVFKYQFSKSHPKFTELESWGTGTGHSLRGPLPAEYPSCSYSLKEDYQNHLDGGEPQGMRSCYRVWEFIRYSAYWRVYEKEWQETAGWGKREEKACECASGGWRWPQSTHFLYPHLTGYTVTASCPSLRKGSLLESRDYVLFTILSPVPKQSLIQSSCLWNEWRKERMN